MNIKSLSYCVPAGCPNACKYCVSHMNRQPDNTYENFIERNCDLCEVYERDYRTAMAFARDNGCNTAMYTGSGEPMMNMSFILRVAAMNRQLARPFRWEELQSSGILLNEASLSVLRRQTNIRTISVSLAHLWSSMTNTEINGIKREFFFSIEELCRRIKAWGFNLRLSLNMSDLYDGIPPERIFERAQALGADQLTFRKLFVSDIYADTPQAKWIEEHRYTRPDPPNRNGLFQGLMTGRFKDEAEWHEYMTDGLRDIEAYVLEHGRPLEILPYGAQRYSVHGMSTLIDLDCMNKTVKDDGSVKYLILRPDCHIYTRWDDKGSLLF